MMQISENKVIGRTEKVDLPEWELTDIEAKIDTGAYTSSLHCHHIEAFVKDGKSWLRFRLLDPDHEAYNDRLLECPLHDEREVKSSNGQSELRYFIQTKIKMFGEIFTIELSLADRSAMKYPLLIGRKYIKKTHLLVDVSQTNLSSKYLTEETK